MRKYWNRWVNILVVVASTITTTSNLLLGSCRPNLDECELKEREREPRPFLTTRIDPLF